MQDSSHNRRVILAGATGWAGSALAKGIGRADDLSLIAGVARTHAGKTIAEAIGPSDANGDNGNTNNGLGASLYGSASDALAAVAADLQDGDVFFEFTKPDVARSNIVAALEAGLHVVVGTSGLTSDDFSEIDKVARRKNLGVLACGNFALTAVLMQKFSEMAARWVRHWEIIDYAHAGKVDAPSGTARELAQRLSQSGESTLDVPLDQVKGEQAARGVRLDGSQVHSVRLPGFVIAIESIFGMDAQKLVIRHEAGSSAEPYVDGALLAIRSVSGLVGVHRGLDTVMDWT